MFANSSIEEQIKMKKRIRNLIYRLASGDDFYTNATPRISKDEIAEIDILVSPLQVESIYGAEAGSPRVVYPLQKERFRAKAKEILNDRN